jgi:DNA polymerase-3 subunit gamma/tau
LLDLIDQFAVAEGRMKWAPNKKLHFEVAIIRAIQTLGQATLDEVIQKLGELREDGGVRPSTPSAQPVAARADHSRGEGLAQKAGITDPGYSKVGSARVAESPSKYKADPVADVDPVIVWQQVSAKIPQQKGFLRNSAAAAHVLGIEGRNFQLGFAPSDKAMMDIMGTQANRKFLETMLHEITEKDWSVKLTVNEQLPSKPAAVSDRARPDDFKNDPVIQQAIELFKAEIRP